MLSLPPVAATWFLLPVALVSFLAAFNDLKRMKLPNPLVIALALVYVAMGPFLLPFDQYLWGFSHGVVMYLLGMLAFAFLGVGAGDGKFAAAMSLFIPLADATAVLTLFAVFLLGAFAAHRALRALPAIRRAAPDWVSWDHHKFPMGLALAGTMVSYLALAIVL
ncbi:prepilin peptidase [Celeribacter indicus]|uniref:Peptidase A24A prepilin type IV n=1 Tax=Celeribacter indicus TaxID=1208324 RepID=A0A0B5E0D6_9RHOB|nr:A24 family peptidase [Celeribacter indicus]AJE45922.1 peptidase A24A prepilin type IV [Celeribacter indicus]SDW63835.1 prepilin peptidase CpaA [Celeribacter indicus]